MEPTQIYLELLNGMRRRFDSIAAIESTKSDEFSKAEFIAFQSRKIIEATAFCCLVALHNGLRVIPSGAEGQWNAEIILKNLKKKHPDTFPGPNQLRAPKTEEEFANGAKVVLEGVPERRLTHGSLIGMYQRMHGWLHEINPYTSKNKERYVENHAATLRGDVDALYRMLECHVIIINGEGIVAMLRHPVPHQSFVGSISKLHV